jgi:hypothetical protein
MDWLAAGRRPQQASLDRGGDDGPAARRRRRVGRDLSAYPGSSPARYLRFGRGSNDYGVSLRISTLTEVTNVIRTATSADIRGSAGRRKVTVSYISEVHRRSMVAPARQSVPVVGVGGGLICGTLAGDREGVAVGRLVRRRCVPCLREASLRGLVGCSPVQVWAGGAMTVKLQVRRLVRTLSVLVHGVSRFASLPARTYGGQGTLFI